MLNNISIIIRSTGERTEDMCRYSILQNGIQENQISIVKNVSPFSRALNESYKLAMEKNKEFTFFVDADMILLPDAIPTMLTAVRRLPPVVFFTNPLCYDYLTGYILPNGPKLYRTEFLKQAIKLIPHENDSLRPETFTSKQMREKGHEIIYLDFPCALHEFEQYYKDIFSRIFNKFYKSKSKRKELEDRIIGLKDANQDFEIAHKAIERAKQEKNNLKLRLDYTQLEKIYAEYKIKEKPSLGASSDKYHELINNTFSQTKNYKLISHTSKIWKQPVPKKKGLFWK